MLVSFIPFDVIGTPIAIVGRAGSGRFLICGGESGTDTGRKFGRASPGLETPATSTCHAPANPATPQHEHQSKKARLVSTVPAPARARRTAQQAAKRQQQTRARVRVGSAPPFLFPVDRRAQCPLVRGGPTKPGIGVRAQLAVGLDAEGLQPAQPSHAEGRGPFATRNADRLGVWCAVSRATL